MARLARVLPQIWLSRSWWARCLWPIAVCFGWLVRLRRIGYERGWTRAESLSVPVVVVGNLVAGGAGKTPTVIAVVSMLRDRGYSPGVISRGYGRRDDTAGDDDIVDVDADTPARRCGDEPLLLRLRLGEPVAVGRDRVAAARTLLQRHPQTDVLVSDDGLQHLRLPRCAEVIVFDERGAGNGWLLPAGPLREPMDVRAPPRSLVVYNAPQPTTPWPGHCGSRRLQGAVSLADWWAGQPATQATLQRLAGRSLLAAAGVARPERFFDMLRNAGLAITPLPLPDHHGFATPPWPEATADVVLTEKDAVKLIPARAATTRVWVAPLDFNLDAAFGAELVRLIRSA